MGTASQGDALWVTRLAEEDAQLGQWPFKRLSLVYVSRKGEFNLEWLEKYVVG